VTAKEASAGARPESSSRALSQSGRKRGLASVPPESDFGGHLPGLCAVACKTSFKVPCSPSRDDPRKGLARRPLEGLLEKASLARPRRPVRDGPFETVPRDGTSRRPFERAPRNGPLRRPLETVPLKGPYKRRLWTAPHEGPPLDSRRPLETAPRSGTFGGSLERAP